MNIRPKSCSCGICRSSKVRKQMKREADRRLRHLSDKFLSKVLSLDEYVQPLTSGDRA